MNGLDILLFLLTILTANGVINLGENQEMKNICSSEKTKLFYRILCKYLNSRSSLSSSTTKNLTSIGNFRKKYVKYVIYSQNIEKQRLSFSVNFELWLPNANSANTSRKKRENTDDDDDDEVDSKKQVEKALAKAVGGRNRGQQNIDLMEIGEITESSTSSEEEEEYDTEETETTDVDVTETTTTTTDTDLEDELEERQKDSPEYYVIAITNIYSLIGLLLLSIIVILPIYTCLIVILMYRYTTTVIPE